MDIKEPIWHSQIQITGSGAPINDSGNIFELLSRAVVQLKTSSGPRASGTGKRIIIVLQTTPFGDDKASVEQELKVAEIAAVLPTDTINESIPQPGENAAQYYHRLDSLGYDPTTATMLVTDWFNESPSDELAQALRWINDPKAQRFRMLNTSQDAYAQAMPNEYESLRHYVLSEYPDQCERITFRSAH